MVSDLHRYPYRNDCTFSQFCGLANRSQAGTRGGITTSQTARAGAKGSSERSTDSGNKGSDYHPFPRRVSAIFRNGYEWITTSTVSSKPPASHSQERL